MRRMMVVHGGEGDGVSVFVCFHGGGRFLWECCLCWWWQWSYCGGVFFFAGADFVVVVSLGPGLQHLTSIHLLWPNCCVHVSICLDLVGWCHFHVGKQKDESLPVVPGQAGGGSFQKEKNYIAQKEFAYRMCAW